MALRTLMLKKRIDNAKKCLEALREKDSEFATREAELETSIEEASTEEERQVVEDAVTEFETEKAAHDQSKSELEEEIQKLEGELAEQEAIPAPVPAPEESKPEERKVVNNMKVRTLFAKMSMEERTAFFENEQVKSFISEVRTCIKEKRALSNAGLLIPEVSLGLLREATEMNSKLISRVNRVPVSGKGRQVIAGTIPEAVWTEMCATLNELDLGFNNVEVDGYKVGGFVAICNATLEDSDIDLVSEVFEAIGAAIGKALDKAIVFGKGVKMPLGFVTRLAQTMAPSDYPATARPWVDLHTSNIVPGTGNKGLALFKEIFSTMKVTNNDFSTGQITFIMNKNTHMDLIGESIDKNANAAIVAGMNNTMPIVGGDIVELSFMADGDIAFGYLDLYLLAERAGVTLGQSDQVKFLEEQTVFKGSARYDGKPVIAEAFGIFNITGAPTTTATFPTDTAN